VSREDGSDDEHHAGHPGGTTDQTPLSAPFVDPDQQEDPGCHDLDGPVDTRGEERRVGLADPDGLEDLRGVVADAVGAGELLPEHQQKGQQETVTVSLLQALLPGGTLGGGHFLLQRDSDLGHFLLHVRTVGGFVADIGQRLQRLLVAALLHEPARRLLQEQEADEQERAGDDLDGHGDAPLLRARGDVQGDAVVEPVGKGAADDEELLEQSRHTTPRRRGTVFADEDGRDARHAADPQARNDTTAIDHADVMMRPGLDRSTEQEHESKDHERVPAAEAIVQHRSENGTEETARRE